MKKPWGTGIQWLFRNSSLTSGMNIFFTKTLKAGLLVGTLDITAACIQTYIKVGKGPDAVLKYLASAVFGKDAYTSGAIMIFIGLAFHYIVAMSYTLFFFWLVQKFPSLLKIKILTAIVYSIFMWAFMEFAVLIAVEEVHEEPDDHPDREAEPVCPA